MWNVEDISEINSVIHNIDSDLDNDLHNTVGWTSPLTIKSAKADNEKNNVFLPQQVEFAEMELKSLLRSNRRKYLVKFQRLLSIRRSTLLAERKLIAEEKWQRVRREPFIGEFCSKLALLSQNFQTCNGEDSNIHYIMQEFMKKRLYSAANHLSSDCARGGSRFTLHIRQFADLVVEGCLNIAELDIVLSNLDTFRLALYDQLILKRKRFH